MYVEDDLYAAVYEAADQGLKDAMDLSYLTAQRVADTLKMDERDIRDGTLAIRQGKTLAKRRIEVIGELKLLIDRIMARKTGYRVRSTRLVVIDDGQPMTYHMLRGRFDRARDAAGIPKSAFQGSAGQGRDRYRRIKWRHSAGPGPVGSHDGNDDRALHPRPKRQESEADEVENCGSDRELRKENMEGFSYWNRRNARKHDGARSRGRTGTGLPPRDFKSLASTDFAIRAGSRFK
ncbi:phage integrase family protein [Pseudomonas paraeruginosa]|uniref:Phage integrase family protein n=1 Tax=Pseudomonas paraeruginosa TaxID=2994495 RepID=A0A2R3J1M7_9PSED|nr:phage integrase family protein [Pseudomonas paraeruginosa]